MGQLRISIGNDLHKNLKRRAIDEGVPMRDLLVKVLEEYVEHNPPLSSSDETKSRKMRRLSRRRRNRA